MKTLPMLAILLAVAGCTGDPYRWENHWDATQANAANAAMQAANWRDVVSGHGDPGADGEEAAAAVARLRAGKVHPLTDASISDVAPLGAGGAGASLGTPGGGTP